MCFDPFSPVHWEILAFLLYLVRVIIFSKFLSQQSISIISPNYFETVKSSVTEKMLSPLLKALLSKFILLIPWSSGTLPSLLSQMLWMHRETLPLFQHILSLSIAERPHKDLTLIIEPVTRRRGEEKFVLWGTSLIRDVCLFQHEKPSHSINAKQTPHQVQSVQRTLIYQLQDWRAHLALLGFWPWLKIAEMS